MEKIKILGKIPRKVTLACSGGPDSMAALDFLSNSSRNLTAAYFDHGTSHGKEARSFIEEYCREKNIELYIGEISDSQKPKDQSWEEWWRNSRYEFFKSIEGEIITCHHLNDVAEWWIFSSLNGEGKLIPYRNNAVIRPFLKTKKSAFVDWCTRKGVPFLIDPGNIEDRFARSKIRNKIMPHALEVNPGLLTVLEKKINTRFESSKG